VINALKHAFPDHLRQGRIAVGFTAAGVGWTLAVADNGIGKSITAEPGLGTAIIEALAKQLNARIEVRDADPGTRVLVIHDPPPQQ
jgi:two-component system, sensor histidine kinase PdtaS